MDLTRRGNSIRLDDLTRDQRIGLEAVLKGNQAEVTPEQWSQGQMVWAWFCENVFALASIAKLEPQ